MSLIYKTMDRVALDAAYNNSLAVSNSAELMGDFDVLSERIRRMPEARTGLRYGPAARNLIDYFPAREPGPVLVFIHGGYWQMRAKESFSFVAQGPLAQGVHVALVGYTLAPDASLADIVKEVRDAVAWLHAHVAGLGGDPHRIVVSGWSAGGHLAAMCLDEPGVVGGLAISGIYDLAPIQLSYLNEKLGLTLEDVKALSPALLPLSAKPLVIAYGDAELPELQNQSRRFFNQRTEAGKPGRLLAPPGVNHFTVLKDWSDSASALVLAVKALATGPGKDASGSSGVAGT